MVMKIIQLQGSTEKLITDVFSEVKEVMSTTCGGIDDMHYLGNKALIVRAEIFSERLGSLCEKLCEIDVRINSSSVPVIDSLDTQHEYMITLQVTSFSDDTDRRTVIPKVPG